MLSTRVAKVALVAGAMIIAAMGPAMAAGPPDGAGAGSGSDHGVVITAPAIGSGGGQFGRTDTAGGGPSITAGEPGNPGGGGGGNPDRPGGGGGNKPEDPGGGGGKPGGETAGNNLSFPVLWSEDGRSVSLPGEAGVVLTDGPVLPGTYTPDDSTPCMGAIQKNTLNSWQADSMTVAPNSVTTIDWGDNLESKDWRLGTVVRVETGLYKDIAPDTMTRYEMCYISGSGTDEVWGLRVTGNATDGYEAVTTDSPEAMVYTAGARLTIQQIVPDLAGGLTWDEATHAWTGPGASDPVFNMAAWERVSDGPGSYGAELNVSGKIVYGFVWTTADLEAGEYRLTFSLDNDEGFDSGATLVEADILGSTEIEVSEEGDGGNTAVVDRVNDLTYIDVGLVPGGGSTS
jgi:hypothetical protein